MPQLRIRIEEMEYRPEDRSLCLLAVDEFHKIVTIEIAPVYPRQLAADLEFVASHPNARVVVDEVNRPSGAQQPEGNEEDHGRVD